MGGTNQLPGFSSDEQPSWKSQLVVRDEISSDDTRLTDRAVLKYPSSYDHAWHLMVRSLTLRKRYYELHFKLFKSAAAIQNDEYRRVIQLDAGRERADEHLSDCLRFIASLASVDGAVVITDRLRLIGFGAEVIALSPALTSVKLAVDVHGQTSENLSIENYGTRHRSAFRFCSSYEDSVAFIVSQDGGVKAAKRHKRDVFLWPDVDMGRHEI